jgi:adenosylhomocysteine nucleosidase
MELKLKVVVTFAVEAEFAPWRLRRGFARRRLPEHDGAARCYSALVGQSHVDVLITGMAVRKGEPGLSLLLQEGADICISSGLAGALRPGLVWGEIAVARRLAVLGGEEKRDCDPRLVELAIEMGATGVDTFLMSDSVLGSSEVKRRSAVQGDVVEMESFSIVARASEKWIPSVAIRAISDTTEEDLPIDFNRAMNSRGEVKLSAVLSQIARRPAQLPKLIRFGKRSEEAANRLSDFLDAYVQALDSESLDRELAVQNRGAK